MHTLTKPQRQRAFFGRLSAIYGPQALIVEPEICWRERYAQTIRSTSFHLLARPDAVLGQRGLAEQWKYRVCLLDPLVFSLDKIGSFICAYKQQQPDILLYALGDFFSLHESQMIFSWGFKDEAIAKSNVSIFMETLARRLR